MQLLNKFSSITLVIITYSIFGIASCNKPGFSSNTGKKSASTRTGDSVPDPSGNDGGFIETKDSQTDEDSGKGEEPQPTPTPSPSPSEEPKPKLSCELYVHRNGNHGCGPNGYQLWWVWIDNTLPVLQNSMTITSDLAATAKASGNYGYAKAAYLNKPIYNNAYCDLKPSEVTPMPETFTYENQTYKLWTDGIPGSEDCQAYTGSVSPLIIALNSREIGLLSPAKGPLFDLEANGDISRYSWPKDGVNHMFLALDKNDDGTINSGEELFGNATQGPDKKRSDNGFIALAKYDSNGDKVIDENDAVYSRLLLWGDLNSNGISEKNELFSLKDKGIKKINLEYRIENKRLDFFGSERKEISTIEFTSGKKAPIVDAWFVSGPLK